MQKASGEGLNLLLQRKISNQLYLEHSFMTKINSVWNC